MEINDIRAMLHIAGDHFNDLVSSPKFEVPKTTEPGQIRRHTMFASALWVGGMNNNNLHVAAMTYRQSGSDFWAGPLDNNASITEDETKKWDKFFEISAREVEKFKRDPNQITNAIRNWPAHGDTTKNQSKYLAPFVDKDNDGIYNPSKGDYPKIKGDYAMWWVFNDNAAGHGETLGQPLGIEIHAMAYAFNTQDTTLNRTIFFEYEIVNRSKNNYNDVYLGLWTDFDIGFGFDDYIGSDSSLSAYFGYNGDPDDEGVGGYGDNIPVQSVVFFNDSLKNFLAYNNDFTPRGNPVEPEDYYSYLSGKWLDGKPFVAGCNGYYCPGAKKTSYMYPGNPLDNKLWNERSAGNKPGDRRGLGSTGPLTLNAGDKHTFNFAYVTTFKQSGSTDANLKAMYNDIAKTKKFYNENLNTGTPEVNFAQSSLELSVYPNPATNILTLQWNNSKADNVRLVNMLGQTVWNQSVNQGESAIHLDTKHFPRGIYMAIVESGNQKLVKRVILQ